MIKKFIIFSLLFLVIGIIVGSIHYKVVENLELFYSIPKIYVFNYLITLFSLSLLLLVDKYLGDKVGFAFLGLGLIKMAFSLVFLMPLIDALLENKVPDTLNFFFSYFIFLLAESIVIVRMLNKKEV